MLASLRKGLTVLEAFDNEHREWSIIELSRHLKMPQPTVYRFLSTFKDAGWIIQNPTTKHYRLGIRIWELGCTAVNYREISDVARPYLHQIVHKCQESAFLGMVTAEDYKTVIYIDQVDSERPVRVYTVLGSRAPVHCSAMGKVIVAHNPAVEAAVLGTSLAPCTEKSIVEVEQLREEFKTIRERGYSMSLGEFDEEMDGLAAPIYNRDGSVTMGVGMWAPRYRMTDKTLRDMAPIVVGTANEISAQLGHLSNPV